MYVCGPPVNAITGIESTNAVARPVATFIEPGPMDVSVASGRPHAR